MEDLNEKFLSASMYGKVAEVQKYLDEGADLNYMDKTNLTALHKASAFGHIEIVCLLLDRGSDPNKNRLGDSALHLAAGRGHVDIVRLLIDHGSDLNMKNWDHMIPLHKAVLGVHLNIVQILMDSGSDPSITDVDNKTPHDVVQEIIGESEEMKETKRSIKKLLQEYGEFQKAGLPLEVQNLDRQSASVFSGLLQDESYHHYEARIMLVGEPGIGKTTIARYLVGKGPTKYRVATDGIELYNDLLFMDGKTKQWLDGKQDFSLYDLTVSRSLLPSTRSMLKKGRSVDGTSISYRDQNTDKKTTSHILCATEKDKQSAAKQPQKSLSLDLGTQMRSLYSQQIESLRQNKLDTCCSSAINHETLDTTDDKIRSPNQHIPSTAITNPGVIKRLKGFFGVSKEVSEIKVISQEYFLKESLRVGKKGLHQKQIAPVIIWDFGGQDIFYSTHQTFLTYRAIYILVINGSRTLDDPCPFEQYLPGRCGHKTARDYLKFWANTIITYCKGGGQGYPKIMIVLTHKDKIKSENIEVRRKELFAEITKMFEGTAVTAHLVMQDRIFVNAKDKHDFEMTKIRKNIIDEAMAQPSWGQNFPKCFIPLEIELIKLTEKNVPIITMVQMKKINSGHPIKPLTDFELKVFLKFQHAIGKLLYFDVPNLDQHIILSPTHLIDAFKSIVTDKRFCVGDKKRKELWDVMSEKGVISKQAIDELWRQHKYHKFRKDKEHLLAVMNYLDILVEPKRYDSHHNRILPDFYYVASMVRTTDNTGYLQSKSFMQRNIGIAFQSTSLIIPPALSYRLISYCMSIWSYCIKTYGEHDVNMLFHRCAVFVIDTSLDMYISCEDDQIIIRLVHSRNRSFIMKDLASSISECLASALYKISQLYIKTSSDRCDNTTKSFEMRLCCSAPEDPCFLSIDELSSLGGPWLCPSHGIEHGMYTLTSWITTQETEKCQLNCPVLNEEFLSEVPSALLLRRLSLLLNVHEVRVLVIHLGLSYTVWSDLYKLEHEPELLKFEALRCCFENSAMTFDDIRKAVEAGEIQNPHTICKVMIGDSVDFDSQPEKWDIVPTDEHIDKISPLIGKKSLQFLVELEMDFHTWEQINYRQTERDLVALNKNILNEWKFNLCKNTNVRPSMRKIGQAFKNIGKDISILENMLFC